MAETGVTAEKDAGQERKVVVNVVHEAQRLWAKKAEPFRGKDPKTLDPKDAATFAAYDTFSSALKKLSERKPLADIVIDGKPGKQVIDLRDSYDRPVISDGKTHTVREGLPVNGVLKFLDDELVLASTDDEKNKLKKIKDTLEAGGRTYDNLFSHEEGEIKIKERARIISGNDTPVEADIKLAQNEIQTLRVLELPKVPRSSDKPAPERDASGKFTNDPRLEAARKSGDLPTLAKALTEIKEGEETTHAFPYFTDEPGDTGLSIEEVQKQSKDAWDTAGELFKAARIALPAEKNTDALYKQIEDRIRFRGDYAGKDDSLTKALNAVARKGEGFQILMALEAQHAIAVEASNNTLLDPYRRQEVYTVVGHKTPNETVAGNMESYFKQKPDGTRVGGPEAANANPQKDLYAMALLSDRLLDVKDEQLTKDKDKTYREQMRAHEVILQDKSKRGTPAYTEAAKKLSELRGQFYQRVFDAMTSLNEPTPKADTVLEQMRVKLNEAKNMKISELIAQYEGVGKDNEGNKLTRDLTLTPMTVDGKKLAEERTPKQTAIARMKTLFNENDNDLLLDFGRKGAELLIRRNKTATPEKKASSIRIKRKDFVQGPNGNASGTGKDTDGTSGDNNPTKKPDTLDGDPPAAPVITGTESNQQENKVASPPTAPVGKEPTTNDSKPTIEGPPGPVEPEDIEIGIANRTEAAAQLGDIRTKESVNEGLRRRGWSRFTNWMRRIAEVPTSFRQREGVMNILDGRQRQMLGRANMEATAAAVRAELNASAAGTVDRIKNMTSEQARRRGETIREVRNGSELHTRIWDRMLRSMVVDDRTWTPEQIRTELRDIIRANPRDPDAQAILNAPNRYGDRAQEFASDITQMAKVARERYLKTIVDKDGKLIPEADRLAALDRVNKKVVFILGNERAAAYENGRGWEESLLYRVNARARVLREGGPILAVIGNTLLHPMTVGAIVAIAGRGWAGPVRLIGRIAAPLSPFTPLGVASAAAGVAAGARKWQEANRDYWTVNKDVAYNRRSTGPDARNRHELEQIFELRKAISAKVLHEGGGTTVDIITGRTRRSVAEIKADMTSGDANRMTRAVNEARSRIAEIIKREEMSVDNRKNLITFESATAYGDESANLTKDEKDLAELLHFDISTQAKYQEMQQDLVTELSKWAQELTPGQRAADRRMRNYRFRRSLTAGAISFGTGMVGGVIGQKIASSARATITELRTGQPQYVGPTLFDRMGKGAMEQTRGLRGTGAGAWIENKFSVPPSIDAFKDAFKTGHDVSLPNGFRVHPETAFSGTERHLWLLDKQGVPVLDQKGKALNLPMFVKQDGSIVVHGDIAKAPDLPTEVKAMLSGLPHTSVDSMQVVQMKQALAAVNGGSQAAFFDMPNPVTQSVDRIKVLPGGKFWLPSTKHVMGEIQPDGSVKFTGQPQEMQGLHAALDKAGLSVGNVVIENKVPLHDRITALIKANPTGGDITTDEGRIKITYDANKHITIQDMSLNGQPVLEGEYYMDTETNPTNFPRPGGARGDLVNFRFDIRKVSELKAKNPDFLHNLGEAGFTGQGFNPVPGPGNYGLPLTGDVIALAPPDTSINATMTLTLPKDMLITPPTVTEPWPAIPLPFDPRRELEATGVVPEKKKEEHKTPHTGKSDEHKTQTDTPAAAPTGSGTKPAETKTEEKKPGDIPDKAKPFIEDAAFPADLRAGLNQRYTTGMTEDDKLAAHKAAKENIHARIAALKDKTSPEDKAQSAILSKAEDVFAKLEAETQYAIDEKKKAPEEEADHAKHDDNHHEDSHAKEPGKVRSFMNRIRGRGRKPDSAHDDTHAKAA